jgi:hypothetical protein
MYARGETVLSLLGNTEPEKSQRLNRVGLDIGCGTGYTAKVLEPEWRMISIDLAQRRYTICDLMGAANQSGLSVKKTSYFFLFILPVAIAERQFNRLLVRDAGNYSTDFISIPRWLNKMLIHVGRLERWFIGRFNTSLPFGLSIISVIEKPKSKEYPR